jgi:hypothetical protein
MKVRKRSRIDCLLGFILMICVVAGGMGLIAVAVDHSGLKYLSLLIMAVMLITLIVLLNVCLIIRKTNQNDKTEVQSDC